MATTLSRRTIITDAAITTLATEGMRGLTHRAVDRAADLPEGSTSYYFRTRLTLLVASVERLAELDEVELRPTRSAPDLDAVAALSASLLHTWMTVDRPRQLARYELTLEATRRPELREALVRNGARIRSMVAELLTSAGVARAEDRAPELVAVFEGLLFDQIAGAGTSRAAPGVEVLTSRVRQLLGVLTGD